MREPKIKKVQPESKESFGIANQMAPDIRIDVYSKDNPYSVRNLININYGSIMLKTMENMPEEYKDRDVYEIRDEIKPNATLNQLRLNFWTEYDMCLAETRKIRVGNIIAGICTQRAFELIVKKPKNLAWILTPVQGYTMGVQDILETCLYKMRKGLEELDMDNQKDIALALRIYETFDKRVHGDYTQKIKKEVEYKGVERLEEADVNRKVKELGMNNDVVEIYEEKKE